MRRVDVGQAPEKSISFVSVSAEAPTLKSLVDLTSFYWTDDSKIFYWPDDANLFYRERD